MIEKFSQKQKQILKFAFRPERYLICDGAVRSGKTVVMCISFFIWAMQNFDGCNFAICSKTVANAERNVLTPLLTSEELPYKMRYHRQERMLVCQCGNKINRFYLFGGKDESSYMLIQGITLAGVLLDEVALMPRSFVEQAMARTLTFENAKIWFNCNPEGQLHWFNQEWVIPTDDGKKNAIHLHFLMNDNPIMSEEAIAETSDMFSGVFYDRYILGLWVAAEGLIYDMFTNERHVVSGVKTNGYYYVSCDYGIQNATVFLLWQQLGARRGTWVCVREWYYSGREARKQKTDNELVDCMVEWLDGIYPEKVIVDPSAASLIVALRQRGYAIRKGDNDVLDGIADVGTMLNKGQLLFDTSCKMTLQEFGVYAWDTKAADSGIDRPIKQNDHCMDAVRYFVRTMRLVKREGVLN